MAVEDGGGGDDRIHDDWNGTLVDHFKYGKKIDCQILRVVRNEREYLCAWLDILPAQQFQTSVS